MFCTKPHRWNLISFFRRTAHGKIVFVPLSLLVCMATSQAQTFTSLFSFDGLDGAYPERIALIQGKDGNLYGTAQSGGAGNSGVVLKITTSGVQNTVYNFCSQTNCTDGGTPLGGVVQASNGNLYGTTYGGGLYGYGTVFELTTTGTLTTLYSFCAQAGCPDGSNPPGTLILGSNGTFYGTTQYGGANGCGTVFSITSAGKLATLHSFNYTTDGSKPGGLIQATNGTFYGTTYEGGTGAGYGTFFKMTSSGILTTLYSFCSVGGCVDGGNPNMAPTQGTDGNFYGVTTNFGANGSGGTFYKMTPTGLLTTLYSFCAEAACFDGSGPLGGVIQASDGNFYGTTSTGGAGSETNGQGTVFKFAVKGKTATLTTLYSWCSVANCDDGAYPSGGLLQDTNGIFYGTTEYNGAGGIGTVFSVSTALGPFVITSPSSGKVAAKVAILGNSLTGATSVSFNGTAATFNVAKGGASISTAVPAGATTGLLKVTTPSGTLATTTNFKVAPQLTTFSPTSGPVGTVVAITGVSLTQTSKVTFAGVAATSFTVNSDTQVTATVPTGAKTGKIVITTPGGTASSTTNFTVN